jgi:site-specific DNA-adenine methylase
MKNHFIISYPGNKRDEVERIYNNLNLDDITTICEPYCGTSALSFYVSLKHPKKFKYILNDNDKNLIELYNLMKNKKKLLAFIKKINKRCFDKNNNFISKEDYKTIIQEKTFESWFIGHKFYSIRHSLYPLKDHKTPLNLETLEQIPIINFLRTEDIIIKNMDALDLIKEYQTKKDYFLFIDPPYIRTSYDFYSDQASCSIYEYLYNNPITNFSCLCVLVVEDIWIIRLLFKSLEDKFIKYNKLYQLTKKQTNHLLIKNK